MNTEPITLTAHPDVKELAETLLYYDEFLASGPELFYPPNDRDYPTWSRRKLSSYVCGLVCGRIARIGTALMDVYFNYTPARRDIAQASLFALLQTMKPGVLITATIWETIRAFIIAAGDLPRDTDSGGAITYLRDQADWFTARQRKLGFRMLEWASHGLQREGLAPPDDVN